MKESAIHEGRAVKATDPATAKNGQKGTFGRTAIGFTEHDTVVGPGRNRRSVWEVATVPHPGAHFATFPPALVEPCILAGTSQKGACPACGAPWERAVERDHDTGGEKPKRAAGQRVRATGGVITGGTARSSLGAGKWRFRTTGWRPTCECDAGEPVPCTVLDPFGGSGTTAMVATGHGRRAVIIELNPEYAYLARERSGPMLVSVA